jgi:hypothetical protein
MVRGTLGVVSLWDMILVLSGVSPVAVALGAAKGAGGGEARYVVAFGVGLAFTALSLFGSRRLGRRAAEVARSGVAAQPRLRIIYGVLAAWGLIVVPAAAAVVAVRVLRVLDAM